MAYSYTKIVNKKKVNESSAFITHAHISCWTEDVWLISYFLFRVHTIVSHIQSIDLFEALTWHQRVKKKKNQIHIDD